MIRPQHIVFDLDGTLFDTSLDLAGSVNFALAQFSLPTHELDAVVSFIGNGSLNLIKRAMDREDDALAQDIHRVFLAHYLEHCCELTKPYAGVLEFLAGPWRVSILTNKPDAPTRKILAHFGLQNRFDYVLCGDTTPARKPAPEGLLAILQGMNVEPANALMVGDDLPDIGAAKAARVPSLSLLNGFGQYAELIGEGPTFLADDFAQFSKLISA